MDKKPTKLEKLIERYGLSEGEVETFLKGLSKPPKRHNTYEHFYGERRTKLGFFPDTHIGSKFFRPDIFDAAIKKFNQEKVDAVYHVGDIIEGMSNREGHIYELETLGVSNQVNQAAELLNQVQQPFYFITGNHDGWSRVKGNQGVSVGDMLEDKIKDSKFLGEMYADIQLHPNVKLRLSHEGNSSYTLSYSGQKRINGLQAGTKPNIIVNGHLHKSLYMMYRNIHYFEAGSMEDQTPFMAMKGSPAMLGFWILDVRHNKGGISQMKPTFYPFYE